LAHTKTQFGIQFEFGIGSFPSLLNRRVALLLFYIARIIVKDLMKT
jgi:hypothetical protein